jgi:peptidyl-prolyl cis-trans isomerase A (cyclophilin A)
MKKITILSLLCAVTFGALSQNGVKKPTTTNNNKKSNLENGMYAKINTSKGDILIQLEYEKTPLTVANFVALAEGTMENNKKNQGVPYYNGLKFHRVIADFMKWNGRSWIQIR